MAGGRVLIAEDECIVALLLRIKLESWGYQVTAVESTGEGAIAAYDAEKPDLTLLDIYLADAVTGIDVARHIADGGRVVFLTASQDRDTRAQAQALGPAAIVSKPFSDELLRRVLAEAAGTEGSAQNNN